MSTSLDCSVVEESVARSGKSIAKYTFVAAAISCLYLIAVPQTMAAVSGRCTAEVLYSEELPYGPIGSWLVKATMKITRPRDQAFVSTRIDYVPWQESFRRGDTFRFDCNRIGTYGFHLLGLVR